LLFELKERFRSRYAEVRILELLSLSDDRFDNLLKAYMSPLLIRGTPSIFITLSELDTEKLDKALQIARETEVPISSIPIVHNFAADVLSAREEYLAALEELSVGIRHTPTCLELINNRIRIFSLIGRISEAVEAAERLAIYDPADRNTNTTLVKVKLLNGQLQEALALGSPFAIDHKGNSKLFQTQYNQLCLRCGRCALRAGDFETAGWMYRSVITSFEAFRKAQFNYLGWGVKRIVSIENMLRWADGLAGHKTLARAAVGLFRIALHAGTFGSMDEIALKMTITKDPMAAAFAAAFFAQKNDVLPALKCYIKATGVARFAAHPIVAKLMANIPDEPAVVKAVATELYQPFLSEPQTAEELLMAARGQMFLGDADGVKTFIFRAAAADDLSFKIALDAFVLVTVEMNDAKLGEEVEGAIHAKFPDYEVRFKGAYAPPDPALLSVEDDS
jgi:tetratricopeptide (TPR) repeat protein